MLPQEQEQEWITNLAITEPASLLIFSHPLAESVQIFQTVCKPELSGYLTVKSEDSEWIGPERQIVKILVEQFKTIPQISSIAVKFENGTVSVWTLLKNYDREAREEVYTRELDICRGLQFYDFDFRVTSEDLVSTEELERSGNMVIFRSK